MPFLSPKALSSQNCFAAILDKSEVLKTVKWYSEDEWLSGKVWQRLGGGVP